MTCSPSPPSDVGASSIDADNQNINYAGHGWTEFQGGSRETQNKGDSATYMFTGTAIQVFAHAQESDGNALFGVDKDSQQNGGDTCNPSPQQNPSQALWGTSGLSGGQHTLVVTNKGQQLILDSIVVLGGPSTTFQTRTTIASPASSTSAQISTAFRSTPAIIPSSGGPPGTSNTREGPSTTTTASILTPSMTTVTSTQSQTDVTPASTHSDNDTGSIVRYSETLPVKSGWTSTTSSGYTTTSTIDGLATTIIVQPTIIVFKETSRVSGLSKGAIAGVAVGVISFFMLLVGTCWWWRRRNRVRFLYGISHLDFGPTVASSSDVELSSQNVRARESEVTLYSDALAEYKRPFSYASFASDAEKRPLPHPMPTPPGLSQEQQAAMHNAPCFWTMLPVRLKALFMEWSP
ncbi:hypothetical protein BD310DRAFT_932538 [Dichomitus squalens]|uniref:Uncharacterized protein n=1 Tax=Dichomitus squalens TaxID=114155 RepID=A0A4Q9PP71_9APHY|nr:hypothetical protein BD310DRAFT_932538 [Dichomitus squalens]